MDKATLMDRLRAGRAEWEALLARVPRDRMEEPGVEGEWSIKDIIAHITWNEREAALMLREHSLANGSELWNLPQDDRNKAVFERNHDRPLSDVLAESQQASQQLLAVAETLTDKDLNDPHQYAGMPEDWQPWQIVAGCSFTHYPDHIEPIQAWLAASEPKGSSSSQ